MMKKKKPAQNAETPARKLAGMEEPAGDTSDSIEKLRISEARFRAVFDQAKDGIFIETPEGKILDVNRAVTEMLGYSREELLKMRVGDLVPPEIAAQLPQTIRPETVADGVYIETEEVAKDGTRIPVEVGNTLVEIGGEKRVIAIVRDITERKRAEAELRESQRQLDLFFSQSLDGFFFMLLDEPVEWNDSVEKEKVLDYVFAHQRMTRVNRAMLDQYGAKEEEFIGLTPGDLFAHDLEHGREIWRGLFDNGRRHVETRERRLDGTPMVIDGDYICLYDDDGRITGHFGVQTDITERKRDQDALKESESYLRGIVSVLPDIIIRADREGRYLDVIASAEQKLYLDKESTLGKTVSEVLPEETAKRIMAAIEDALAEQSVQIVEYQIEVPEGILWFEARVAPQNEKEVVALIIDITERKRAEEALAEETTRRRVLIEQSRDGIVILDQEGGVREANRRFAEMLGYSLEEVRDLCVWDWDRQLPREQILEMLRTVDEKGDHFETRHRRKDGTFYDVEISTNGAVIGGRKLVFCLCRDITGRKRAEEALKRSEERFKSILLYAPLAIQGYRTDGTVVYWNREAERVYGYTAEEAVGRNLGDLIIPEEIRPMFEESLSGCSALEKSGEFMPAGEVSLLRKDGSRVPVHSIHTAVCVEEEEPMLFCLDLDLSQRKRAEAERLKMEQKFQQTQKLESLGVLAGGIAHDFNNILMVILGNAELALREMGSLSPARESVSEISAASRQAAELCKQMLAYAGRASFEREPLDLAALIKETAHLIKVSTSRGVVLKYELEPVLVEGDPSQLRQVVMNLVINSSEAIGERSGVITIATGKVSLDGEEARRRDPSGELKAGEYVRLRVADNGRGMDEETRSRVFEPFFTTKFTGRGLGLAAVLGIVQGHGGAISAESEPDLGTTFQVLLPALGKETEALPVERADRKLLSWTGTGTILIAEDEDRVRTLAARILEEMGFTVLSTADGREAVEVYREHGKEIDLVILDLTMPHLDGAGALEKILEIDPEARVILASGFSEEELGRRFRGRGLAGILQKPYDLDSFAAAVRRALTK